MDQKGEEMIVSLQFPMNNVELTIFRRAGEILLNLQNAQLVRCCNVAQVVSCWFRFQDQPARVAEPPRQKRDGKQHDHRAYKHERLQNIARHYLAQES